MPDIAATAPVLILVGVAAYLLGSIPFGIVVARMFGLGDPRKIGSGNIGATNVLRTGNKRAAALTLLFDAGKGAIAVLLARSFVGEDAAQIAGVFAFLGHLFPVFLKFKGGKGVATFLGTLLALVPFLGMVACFIWLVVAGAMRYSSLAALVSAATAPIIAIFSGFESTALAISFMACLVFVRHWENIKRLWAGSEPKIGSKKPPAES